MVENGTVRPSTYFCMFKVNSTGTFLISAKMLTMNEENKWLNVCRISLKTSLYPENELIPFL